MLRVDTQKKLVKLVRGRLLEKRMSQDVAGASAYTCKRSFQSQLETVDRFLNEEDPAHRPWLFLSGHQPELFHPGVWYKNAVISRLAQDLRGLAINLIIDHDLPKHAAIQVPTEGTDHSLTRSAISPLDIQSNVPWEMLDQFATIKRGFAEQVQQVAHNLLPHQPLIDQYWSLVLRAVDEGTPIGQAFAFARHELELQRGWSTMELPMSEVCDTWEFGQFVAMVVADAERFAEVYNKARKSYRDHQRIRNQAHPVPPLGMQSIEDTRWIELPFWIYSDSKPKREGLWLVHRESRFVLSSRPKDLSQKIEVDLGTSPSLSLTVFERLKSQGIRIRSRALSTTLFLRVFAADLFVHGIGGGMYDQVTDQIIREWLSIEAPVYMVASASLHLPMFAKVEREEFDVAGLQQRIRQTVFQPEKTLTNEQRSDATIRELVNRKQVLLQSIPMTNHDHAKSQWHVQLSEVNEALSLHTSAIRRHLEDLLKHAKHQQRQKKLIQSREYAFVLFELDDIFQRFQQLLPRSCPSSIVLSQT